MLPLVKRVLGCGWSGGLPLLLLFNADAATARSSPWLVRDWQTDEGLPNNTIHTLAQTPDGFLWLGTPTGLVRFDGVQFQEFSSTNFIEVPNRGVLMMTALRNGGLFLGMDRGAVAVLESGSVRVFLPGEGRDLPDEVPYSMVEDGEGGLWIAYRAGVVCRITGRTIRRFSAQDGLPEGITLCALTCDSQGRLWFAKGRQFGVFQEGRFQAKARMPSALVSLAPARDGGVWICAGARLLKYTADGRLLELGPYSAGGAASEPKSMLEDREGTVWIGTSFNDLVTYDGAGFAAVRISHREVTGLIEDREGNIWAGTTGGGLNRIRPRTVELEGTEAGLPFEAVQSICEDTNGVIWCATQNGLIARRVEGRWHTFTPATNWTSQTLCVSADPAGNVWLGTRLNGLKCWRDGELVEWGDASQQVGQTIHTLQYTRSGDLWIGEDTPNAVQRLRNRQLFTLQAPAEELRVIRAMTEAADGTVWIGTSRGHLFRVDGDHLVNETARTTGEPTSIRCLAATPDGSVWVGYAGWGSGWGVGRLKGGHFRRLGTQHGLFDDFISNIVADDHGWLWFAGDRGIFKVRLNELNDLAEDRIQRVRSIHYGKGEGLPSLQANFGGAPSVLRSRDGRIWLPMRTALAVINPAKLREDSSPPPVLLHRVMVDERTVAMHSGVIPLGGDGRTPILDLRNEAGPLRLPPRHHRVVFEFAALSFTAPENVHFRYRLDGYYDDWVDAGDERSAGYSRLASGRYRFRVIACNSEGVWSETGGALDLVVTPFFWQTWYFRLGLLAAFTLCVIAVVRYVSFRRLRLQLRRFEQQEALHRERARIAKDIHDDVGANLTQIALLGDLAQHDGVVSGADGARLDTISRTARQAVKSLDEIVWAVNPRNDTLAHLIDYTGQFALDYLRVAGIRCRLDLPEQTPAREVSTDIRHNLFLVVKEALNNIVKHAHATEVWLRVNATDDQLRIEVEDNGCGFDRSAAGTGADGLRNMRQRVLDIGGGYQCDSRAGVGTKITVTLPWPDRNGLSA